jgi:hypothetical protein
MIISETTLEEIALEWSGNRDAVVSALDVTPFCEDCESLYYHPAYQFDRDALDWYCMDCGERVTDTAKPAQRAK